jgi:hypothetical protein
MWEVGQDQFCLTVHFTVLFQPDIHNCAESGRNGKERKNNRKKEEYFYIM